MPIIFFNIGWMWKYQGETDGDRVESNFQYVKDMQTGHEQYNFLPIKGYLYGYAPIKWDEGKPKAIRLERIGGDEDCESMSNVTVVFFSLRPQNKDAYIVGWYRDATIYRYPQIFPGRIIAGDQFYYSFKTRAKNGVCVPVSQRTFVVPSSQKIAGGYGMSCIWYADKIHGFKEKAEKYISNYKPESHTAAQIKAHPNKNIENKLLVERNAVNAVINYYENLGFTVESVEKDNVGWDLETTHPDGTQYFIEVKGLAGDEISVQLTANEYRALRKEYKKYILAICTNSLDDPIIHIFSIIRDGGEICACDDDGNILDFIESVAAIARMRE